MKKKLKRPGTRNLRPVGWVLLAGLLLLVSLPVATRWRWRQAERSDLGDAVAAVEEHACLACHRTAGGSLRWRAYGEAPVSINDVRSALDNGRPVAPGFGGPMPAYGGDTSRKTIDRLVLGVGVWVGLVARPLDSALEVGRDIAIEMGCFGCHGPLGAGGVVNPGSASGLAPGFFGAVFRDVRQAAEGLVPIIREGSVADAAWWSPWRRPTLAMPAFGDRLDSTELELLVRYLEWLADQDVTTRESDS